MPCRPLASARRPRLPLLLESRPARRPGSPACCIVCAATYLATSARRLPCRPCLGQPGPATVYAKVNNRILRILGTIPHESAQAEGLIRRLSSPPQRRSLIRATAPLLLLLPPLSSSLLPIFTYTAPSLLPSRAALLCRLPSERATI
ncbi:hypothetical protein SEVIR_5G352600v4 [Setaria viridis]|uniref:Uncharacterized protein n=2 Tax=Setaria TaxID=4554 RepID=A0A368RBZ3_SETIT|nr:hypothetical protein SETIT_5G347900v2 [Setaria italica]TKW17233.1 hypothetical protein SEVIR_5G352600v2 [Setaria viridis]